MKKKVVPKVCTQVKYAGGFEGPREYFRPVWCMVMGHEEATSRWHIILRCVLVTHKDPQTEFISLQDDAQPT